MTSCPASTRRRGGFDLAGKAEELAALDERASQPDFWNDSREAKRVLRAADGLREELEAWNGLISRADDLAELSELAEGADDAEHLIASWRSQPSLLDGIDKPAQRFILFGGDCDRHRNTHTPDLRAGGQLVQE